MSELKEKAFKMATLNIYNILNTNDPTVLPGPPTFSNPSAMASTTINDSTFSFNLLLDFLAKTSKYKISTKVGIREKKSIWSKGRLFQSQGS